MIAHEDLYTLIREIPDFPVPGIKFKDITPLLANPAALALATNALCEPFRAAGITAVVGIEARGFIFGSLVANALQAGFIPIRKAGKLPAPTFSEKYTLEYGQDQLHIHRDALCPHDRVLLIDDVLATGGTAAASLRLIDNMGAHIVGCGFLINLRFLGARQQLPGTKIHSVLNFD